MKIDLTRTISKEKTGEKKSRKCGQDMRLGEMHADYSVKHRIQTKGQEERGTNLAQ